MHNAKIAKVLLLSCALFCVPARILAQQAAVTYDAQRIEKYSETIKGYLGPVIAQIENSLGAYPLPGTPGALEYIRKELLNNYGGLWDAASAQEAGAAFTPRDEEDVITDFEDLGNPLAAGGVSAGSWGEASADAVTLNPAEAYRKFCRQVHKWRDENFHAARIYRYGTVGALRQAADSGPGKLPDTHGVIDSFVENGQLRFEYALYHLKGASAYPQEWSASQQKFIPQSGQQAAQLYAQCLKIRDQRLAEALSHYLFWVQCYYADSLKWNNFNGKAPEWYFTLAKRGVAFAYAVMRKFGPDKLARERSVYRIVSGTYAHFADFYDRCYAIWKDRYTQHPALSELAALPAKGWNQAGEGDFARLDWDTAVLFGCAQTYLYVPPDGSQAQWRSQRQELSSGSGSENRLWFVSLFPGVLARGNYDLTQIADLVTSRETNAPEFAGLDPGQYANRLVERIVSSYTGQNEAFEQYRAALDALSVGLNALLAREKGIPQNLKMPPAGAALSAPALRHASAPLRAGIFAHDYIADNRIIVINDQYSSVLLGVQAPRVESAGVLATNTANRLPCSVRLSAQVSDQAFKNTALTCRWVITGIPDTASAKSRPYCLYQTIGAGPTAIFSPDLAGRWVVTLILSNGMREAEESVVFDANRQILWVRHDDREITLKELSWSIQKKQDNYLFGVKIRGGRSPGSIYTVVQLVHSVDFYQEIAHEEAAVYRNFDDSGLPVDPVAYCPQPGNLFRLSRTGGKKGAYDGTYGSTDLVHDPASMTHAGTGRFTLASSAKKPCSAELSVQVLDPAITELVLASETSPSGRRYRRSGAGLAGSYEIKQWIDYASWVNALRPVSPYVENGVRVTQAYRFAREEGANGVPDWLEMRAAQSLEPLLDRVGPYVERFKTTERQLGKYVDGEKNLYLNPDSFRGTMRYNEGIQGHYGYGSYACVEAVVRHLAHHSFFWHTVVKESGSPYGPDADGDLLPGSDFPAAGSYLPDEWHPESLYLFLADSPHNHYGPAPAQDAIAYQGDKKTDRSRGRVKLYQMPLRLIQNTTSLFYSRDPQITPPTPYWLQESDPDRDYFHALWGQSRANSWEINSVIQGEATELSAAYPKAAFFLPYGVRLKRPVGAVYVKEVFFMKDGRKVILREGRDYVWSKKYAYDNVVRWGGFDLGAFFQMRSGAYLEIHFQREGLGLLAAQGVGEVQIRYQETLPHEIREYDAEFINFPVPSAYLDIWDTILNTGSDY